MKTVDINATFKTGDASERKIAEFLVSKGSNVRKVDFKTHHYDLAVTDKNGNEFAFEVKTFGAPNCTTLFSETVQISKTYKTESIPEYLTNYENIDYIVWYNQLTSTAYFFDCKVFAEYVLAHKHTERLNSYGTGKGILIHCESEAAGFKHKRTGV